MLSIFEKIKVLKKNNNSDDVLVTYVKKNEIKQGYLLNEDIFLLDKDKKNSDLNYISKDEIVPLHHMELYIKKHFTHFACKWGKLSTKKMKNKILVDNELFFPICYISLLKGIKTVNYIKITSNERINNYLEDNKEKYVIVDII